jgi:predicted phage baseplate assembly protein
MNERGGSAFQPFGALAGAHDVLVMEYECRSDDGLFPVDRSDADGALWPIGVRAEKPLGDNAPLDTTFVATVTAPPARSINAVLVTATDRFPLRVVFDSSYGLLRTGVLLLDVSAVEDSPRNFAIELSAPRGFERPPRVLRIEPNVVPIVQGRAITDEPHTATGLPDLTFQLDTSGLRFGSFEPPVRVELRDLGTNRRTEWRRQRLADSGPNDAVYEFDTATRRVTFGNGVNGQIPPTDTQVLASYFVSDGEQGNVAANRKWQVAGFIGSFGMNVDAVSGGAGPSGSIDERREARRQAREEHALVSSADIEKSALALPLLEVARAWVLTPADEVPQTGTITLVAMRARNSEGEAESVPETQRWLEAIRRRLLPRMLLATRLAVVGPRYIEFSVHATIEAAAGRDPKAVQAAVEAELADRLVLVGEAARHPGVPVTSRDLMGWIRAVDGVRRVISVRLVQASGREVEEIAVPRNGLPRFDLPSSAIQLRRTGSGATA